jgi:excisionase family DNA binding protein
MLFSTKLTFGQNAEVPLELASLPNVLKTRDLAILLDLSPDAVNDMARRGLLKGYKSGNQWRFRRKDVERYIEREKKLASPG